MVVIVMIRIGLQFSVVCEWSDGNNMRDIINGFTPGKIKQFHVVNKWFWEEVEKRVLNFKIETGGYYQETYIIESSSQSKDKVIAFSRSDRFRVKNSHTHNNCFQDINFCQGNNYRVSVVLFDSNDETVESGSIEYPLFVREVGN